MQFSNMIYNIFAGILSIIAIIILFRILIDRIKIYRINKTGIKKQIINSAYLKHKVMYIERGKYNDECYQPVYLIQYEDYDIETALHREYKGLSINYSVNSINNCLYVLVNTDNTELQPDLNYVIEDNYTKAILVVSPDSEFFYLNVIHPKLSTDDEEVGFIHKNKATGLPQITRDDLKYYKLLGQLEALIKGHSFL